MNKRALTLFLFLIASCTRGEESGRLQIAVIPKGTSHEYWKSVHAGAEVAALELDVEILWKGPLIESDRNAQIQVVEDFVTRGVDGIVLMPLDRVALVRPAREAQQAGVPVIIADSDLDWDGRLSFVATDNERGGEMGGEQLAELLGGEGKVILMRYLENSASTTRREEGFLKAMAANPGIEIVSSNQYAGPTIEGAQQTAENLLNAFAEVDGIFCPCEPAAYGMMRAIQDAGRKDAIRFVGFDGSEKLVAGLAEGQVDALVLQSPVAIGDLSVRAMVAHLRGEAVEGRIDTGVVIATQENMSSPLIQALLSPDLSILGE
ncbi:MAG: substrate-binding domain-containing protein [Planctomycetota bacterium]|nr:substrate-binding domain-containing protein [Planctomycetota bacterium]